jgi:hypothetical protein
LKTFRLATLVATLVAAAHAHAARPVSLLLPVAYQSEDSLLHKTKESCKIEDKLATDIGAEYQKRAGEPRTTVSAGTGVVVRVAIAGGVNVGGGGWTGSKSLNVKVEELSDGEVVRARSFSRKSRGGFAGPFEGTCAILEGISETLAQDIVDWSGTQTDARFDADAAARASAKAQAPAEAASDAK